MDIQFVIKDERFFNNGRIILNSLADFEIKMRKVLSMEEAVETQLRKEKGIAYTGINADSLNKALRRSLIDEDIDCETHVENGVFFHNTKEGFDFSVYDKYYNYTRLFNNYLGARGALDGEEKILELYRKQKVKKSKWKNQIHNTISDVGIGKDLLVEKQKLTVVGELQFGNWALVYRDLFRLLDADNDPGIDLYVYITASDHLSDLLSSGTVSYKSAESVIEKYLNIIKTPVWLIGLDIE